MISQEEVKHIAKLARLGLSSPDVKKYQQELSSILGYIEKLKKLDVSEIEATSHPFFIKNITRADEAKKKNQKLTGLAPEAKEGYIKVKSILR